MKINLAAENFREHLNSAIDAAEAEYGIVLDESSYSQIVSGYTQEVLQHLDKAGVCWDRSYRQSMGAGVALQDATPEEREAFRAAREAAMATAVEEICRFVAKAKAEEEVEEEAPGEVIE